MQGPGHLILTIKQVCKRNSQIYGPWYLLTRKNQVGVSLRLVRATACAGPVVIYFSFLIASIVINKAFSLFPVTESIDNPYCFPEDRYRSTKTLFSGPSILYFGPISASPVL